MEKSCFRTRDIKFLSIVILSIAIEDKIYLSIYLLNSKSFEHETWTTTS